MICDDFQLMKEVQDAKVEVTFTDEEVEYLGQAKLARIATSSKSNQPHVVPVAYEFDGKHFYFGGWNLNKSLKFRNIRNNGKVALVVDDLLTVRPWRPRGVEIRGVAHVEENQDGIYVKVTPIRKISWGLVPKTKGD
jgi:pyridoxamine 5'-phosphate oxidase family protein